jgi:hypothetical protein
VFSLSRGKSTSAFIMVSLLLKGRLLELSWNLSRSWSNYSDNDHLFVYVHRWHRILIFNNVNVMSRRIYSWLHKYKMLDNFRPLFCFFVCLFVCFILSKTCKTRTYAVHSQWWHNSIYLKRTISRHIIGSLSA